MAIHMKGILCFVVTSEWNVYRIEKIQLLQLWSQEAGKERTLESFEWALYKKNLNWDGGQLSVPG
jgi:hypothetical protein